MYNGIKISVLTLGLLFFAQEIMPTKSFASNLPAANLAASKSPASKSLADVAKMLKLADDYRLSYSSAKVESLVTLYNGKTREKTRQYHVYIRPNRESLVIFKSQVEAGQKMLMLGDNYWLLMPKSRRPIRITPLQKLLGEASVGDISTLSWSDDYQAVWSGQEQLKLANNTTAASHKLGLTAVTKGASYQRIDLWLDAQTSMPVKADLYLRSGKAAKQAWFEAGLRDGKRRVVKMTLLDKIEPQRKTVIEYQQVTPLALDDKYYNPAFLAGAQELGL